jgi:hypothetical protein
MQYFNVDYFCYGFAITMTGWFIGAVIGQVIAVVKRVGWL